MSTRQATVKRYLDGFRTGDHAMVASCLAPDVVWEIHGQATITGRADVETAIDGDGSMHAPEITVLRMLEDGDTVVVQGRGQMTPRNGAPPIPFVFAEVFAFSGDLVVRLETYHINLT